MIPVDRGRSVTEILTPISFVKNSMRSYEKAGILVNRDGNFPI